MPASKKPKIRRRCYQCFAIYWSNNIRRKYCSSNCNTKYNRATNPEQADAARIRAKKYYHSLNKSERKNQKLVSRYGISIKDYRIMVRQQNRKCAICQKKTKLFVDHCHKRNKIRSLLCNGCNRGIGYFSENPKSMREAALYIERFLSCK